MRPLDDDLVGVREPGAVAKTGAGVADRDPVAEEATDPGDGGGEVDRAEDEHPRRRRERLDEHVELVAAALAVGAVVQGRGAAGVEQAARRRRAPRRRAAASRALPVDPVRPHDERGVPRRSGGPQTTVATATGCSVPIAAATSPSSGNVSPVHLLDEHVDDPAAGQADGERVVVADAVALQHRTAVREDLLAELVDRALDAAAGDAADRLAVRADQHRRAGLARRRLAGADDGRQRRPSRRRPTSGRASSITSRTCHHLEQHLRSVGQAVPGDEVVQMRQGGDASRRAPGRSRPCRRAGSPRPRRCASRCSRAICSPSSVVSPRSQPSEKTTTTAPRATRAAPSGRGTPSAPRRAGCRRSSPGSRRPAAASACSGSRSRSSRVTRVSRVPSVKTSVAAGARAHDGVREAQQRVGVGLHRAAHVDQQHDPAGPRGAGRGGASPHSSPPRAQRRAHRAPGRPRPRGGRGPAARRAGRRAGRSSASSARSSARSVSTARRGRGGAAPRCPRRSPGSAGRRRPPRCRPRSPAAAAWTVAGSGPAAGTAEAGGRRRTSRRTRARSAAGRPGRRTG